MRPVLGTVGRVCVFACLFVSGNFMDRAVGCRRLTPLPLSHASQCFACVYERFDFKPSLFAEIGRTGERRGVT